MNQFEKSITEHINEERERYAKKGYPFKERTWEHHNIGDLVNSVLAIKDEATAKAFYDSYVEWLKANPSPAMSPEDIAKSNIGWCFGEGMERKYLGMWYKVTGARHPVFGTSTPTAQEAFDAGLKRGQAARERK